MRRVKIFLSLCLCLCFMFLFVSNSEASSKIGIIGAMDIEVNNLKAAADISRKIIKADMEFCEGKINNMNVVIVKCGIGKVNAGICAQILIDLFGVTHIINTGVAGSLNNNIKIGDIVIAREAVQHDYDVTSIGFKPGEIPYTGLYAFETDKYLREKALKAANKIINPDNHKIFEGRICTGDQFISNKEAKNKITSVFGGECCEMESGAIAQTCYLNHVPFIIIRSISDTADETEIADFHEFETEMANICANIVKCMIEGF